MVEPDGLEDVVGGAGVTEDRLDAQQRRYEDRLDEQQRRYEDRLDELAALRAAPGNATFRDVLMLVDEVTKLAAALAASEQGRAPTTLGDAEYRVLWRHAEANLRQAAVEVERLEAQKEHWIASGQEYARTAQEMVASLEAKITRLQGAVGHIREDLLACQQQHSPCAYEKDALEVATAVLTP